MSLTIDKVLRLSNILNKGQNDPLFAVIKSHKWSNSLIRDVKILTRITGAVGVLSMMIALFSLIYSNKQHLQISGIIGTLHIAAAGLFELSLRDKNRYFLMASVVCNAAFLYCTLLFAIFYLTIRK